MKSNKKFDELFLFQLRFFLKGYSVLKEVRNLKKEIKNTL